MPLQALNGFGFGVPGALLRVLRSRIYLNPEEPTFLGFLIMISLYKSIKG